MVGVDAEILATNCNVIRRTETSNAIRTVISPSSLIAMSRECQRQAADQHSTGVRDLITSKRKPRGRDSNPGHPVRSGR